MGFGVHGFGSRAFVAREAEVDVDDMAAFFGDDKPVWRVRGLTADELSVCNTSSDKAKNISAIVDALAGASESEKAEAIKAALGIDEAMQPDTVKRMEMLRIASVEPTCDMQTAVKLANVFPIEFFAITNKIMELTGLGQKAGE